MPSKEEKNVFSLKIEDVVARQNISYMEAIIDYCEQNSLELEVAATLLNPPLLSKIEDEAMNLNFIEKVKRKFAS